MSGGVAASELFEGYVGFYDSSIGVLASVLGGLRMLET